MEIRVTIAEDNYLLWSGDNPFSMGVMKFSKDTQYINTILKHLEVGPDEVVTGFTFDPDCLEILDVVREQVHHLVPEGS